MLMASQELWLVILNDIDETKFVIVDPSLLDTNIRPKLHQGIEWTTDLTAKLLTARASTKIQYLMVKVTKTICI